MALRRTFRALSKRPHWDWADPLNINSVLKEEEAMIGDAAKAFCQSTLAPLVLEASRGEKYDASVFKKIGSAGLFAPTLSGYGCGEAVSSVSSGLIAREIERVDSSYRSMWSVQSSLVMWPIYTYGSEELKEKYLPRLASGDSIGCFGLTEANAGSDPAGMTTVATKDGDSWVLNGSKLWISNSPLADVFIVWAKARNAGDQEGHVLGFVLDSSMNGIEAPPIKGKLSLRASCTGGINLTDVRVPDSQRLDVRGIGGPFGCLNQARFGIAWGVWGAAEDCYDAARTYSLQRKMFGAPLASKQLVQTKLADMASEIGIGLAATLHASRLKDDDALPFEVVSILKRNNTKKARDIALAARDIHGGNGIVDEYKVMRHAANLETVLTYEGTYDIHGLIIGRGITGIPSF